MACDSFAVCFSSPSLNTNSWIFLFSSCLFFFSLWHLLVQEPCWELMFEFLVWKLEKCFCSKLPFSIEQNSEFIFWKNWRTCVSLFILCYTILHYYFIILRFLTAFHPYTYSCLSTFVEETVKDSKERWNLYLKIYRLYS